MNSANWTATLLLTASLGLQAQELTVRVQPPALEMDVPAPWKVDALPMPAGVAVGRERAARPSARSAPLGPTRADRSQRTSPPVTLM